MKEIETLDNVIGDLDPNKNFLLENARLMGFNLDHKMDKMSEHKIRKCLAAEILNNPRQVLSRLPDEDLQLLLILKDTEPGIGMKMHPTNQMPVMVMLGLASIDDYDEKLDIVGITEDFKEAVRSCIEEVMESFEVKFRLVIEQFVIGALNIYGMLTKSELKNILKNSLELEDDGSGLFEQVFPQSITLQMHYYKGDNGRDDFFISPFVHDFGVIIDEIENRKEVKTLKSFDINDIKQAGEMPVPDIPNPMNNKLMDMLQIKLGLDEEMAYFCKFLLWQEAQDMCNGPAELIQIILDEVEHEKALDNIDVYNEVIQTVTDFLNHAPRWNMRGRCPIDMMKDMPRMTSAPRISIGPNMQRLGYKNDDMQRLIDKAWSEQQNQVSDDDYYGYDFDNLDSVMPILASPKVGRNDPCPCGSGKKYKNCCGRNN